MEHHPFDKPFRQHFSVFADLCQHFSDFFPEYIFSGSFLEYFFLQKTSMTLSQNINRFIKIQLNNSTQTIFRGVAHEQHWSSMVCLFVGSSIVSYFFLAEYFHASLQPCLWNSYCNLLRFHLESSECHIPQNIKCLIKPNEQTAPKQFFNGEAHEQLISSIVGLFWGVHISYIFN